MPAFPSVESLENRQLYSLVPITPSSTRAVVGNIGDSLYTVISTRLNRTSGRWEILERTSLSTGRRRAISLPAGVTAENFRTDYDFLRPKIVAGRVWMPDYHNLWIVNDLAGTLEPVLRTGDGSADNTVFEFKGSTYFRAFVNRQMRLYRTDGTARRTQVVSDLAIETDLVPTGGYLYYKSDRQLYRTDGTLAGTQPVTLPLGKRDGELMEMAAFGDKLIATSANGAVYVTDGTTGGGVRIRSAESTDDAHLIGTLAGQALFTAGDTTGAYEVWATTGSANGTRTISQFSYPLFGNTISDLHPTRIKAGDTQQVGNSLYVHTNDDSAVGPTLIRIDSGPFKTTVVHEGYMTQFAVADGAIWTTGARDDIGSPLVKSNLSGQNAQNVAGEVNELGIADGHLLVVANGRLYREDATLGSLYVDFGGTTGSAAVYLDLNGNGQKEANEPSPVDGWIKGIPAGSYVLRTVAAKGYVASRPKQTVVINPGQATTAIARFDRLNTTIDFRLYNDANANGKQDTGERPVHGSLIYVENARHQTIRLTSDLNGRILKTGLAPGLWTVHVLKNLLWQPGPVASFTVNLEAGKTIRRSIAFAAAPATGSITGITFRDLNRDGKFNGDDYQQITTVYIDRDKDGGLTSGYDPYRDRDWEYAFTQLSPGTYTVRVEDYGLVNDPAFTVTVKSGQTVKLPIPLQFDF